MKLFEVILLVIYIYYAIHFCITINMHSQKKLEVKHIVYFCISTYFIALIFFNYNEILMRFL